MKNTSVVLIGVSLLAGAAGFMLFARTGAKAGPLRSVPPAGCTDADGDGYGIGCAAGPDCNDHDPAMHPGAVETCNFKDDDCNGLVDDGQAAHRPAQHGFHVNEIGQLGHVPTVPPVPSVCFSPSTGRMMTVSGVVGADIFAPIVSFSPTARAPI